MHRLRISLLLTLICLLNQVSYANNTPVSSWVDKVLISTLSLNYTSAPSVFKAKHAYYMANAWGALNSFLSEYILAVKNQQLILTPQRILGPTVTEDGDFSGIHFWRVNESIAISQLNVSIDFSVVVLETTNPQHPFMIQSINMIKNNN